jgi:alpha-L-fucosidase 2
VIPVIRFCLSLAIFAFCAGIEYADTSCPSIAGNPAGNYMVPGAQGELIYRGAMTLDAYAPPGHQRPVAVLIHGSQGNKSTHLTQLFEVLDRSGFAWFSLNYRSPDDVRAAIRFLRCPGRFNINKHLVIIAEDTGAALAIQLAQEVNADGVVLFDAQFDKAPSALNIPSLVIHGTSDEESPPGPIEAYCRQWHACRFFPVARGMHNFENWYPDQWEWKEELIAWLRGDVRGLWKDITYARPDGHDLRMDAFIPEGVGPFPAVVIVHGGGWEAGDKVTYVSPVFGPLARAGFAWFSIDYRLTPYVRIADQLEDLRSAVRYVREHRARYHVDPDRMAMLGESASGQMVAEVASGPCPGCEVQAVVSFYGVYDFTRWAKDVDGRQMLDRIFGRWDTQTLKQYSPLFHVSAGLPPILLIQGTKDELYEGTLAYAKQLKDSGARHELIVLEGAPHGMENWAGHGEWELYQQRLVDWLTTVTHSTH